MSVPKLTLLCATLWCTSGIGKGFGETSCGDVRRTFASSDLGGWKMVPHSPKRTRNLRICPTDHVTCCTPEMERKYQKASRRNLTRAITAKMSTIKFLFNSFIREFEEDLEDFSAQKMNETTLALVKTFPQHNNGVELISQSLFDSLKVSRYQANRRDMESKIRAAISRTYKSIFSLSLKKYLPSARNLKCASEHYNPQEHFGEVPKFLGDRLIAAYNDTLTFYQAVKSGLEALKLALKSVKNQECNRAFVKMQYCSHCYGLTLIKPCVGLCKNVIRGCLVGMSEMDLYWKHYIGALTATANTINTKRSDIETAMNYLVNTIAEAGLNQTRLSSAMEKYNNGILCKERTKRSSARSSRRHPKTFKRKKSRRRERKNRHAEPLIRGSIIPSSQMKRRIRPPHEVLQLAVPVRSAATEVKTKSFKLADVMIDEVSRSDRIPGQRLRAKLIKFANQLALSIEFFVSLPDELCDADNSRLIMVSKYGSCWDGNNMVDRYEERVVDKGLEGQQNNPEMTIKGLHPEMQKAVEHLRLSSKILLLPNGYDSIPKALRKMPYFVKKAFIKNSSSWQPAPCDDEDDCGGEGSAESSGNFQDYSDEESMDHTEPFFSNGRKYTRQKQLETFTLSEKETSPAAFTDEKDNFMQILNTSNLNTKIITTLPITVEVKTGKPGNGNSANAFFWVNSWLRTINFVIASYLVTFHILL